MNIQRIGTQSFSVGPTSGSPARFVSTRCFGLPTRHASVVRASRSSQALGPHGTRTRWADSHRHLRLRTRSSAGVGRSRKIRPGDVVWFAPGGSIGTALARPRP